MEMTLMKAWNIAMIKSRLGREAIIMNKKMMNIDLMVNL